LKQRIVFEELGIEISYVSPPGVVVIRDGVVYAETDESLTDLTMTKYLNPFWRVNSADRRRAKSDSISRPV